MSVAPVDNKVNTKPRASCFLYGFAKRQSLNKVHVEGGVSSSGSQVGHESELEDFAADWHVLCAPGFIANPLIDKTRQGNFAILDFTRKIALIGGTGYTGEIKKGIFSALNFILPVDKNALPMHCSANVGNDGDTAIFFGLSGTGKTTLSAD